MTGCANCASVGHSAQFCPYPRKPVDRRVLAEDSGSLGRRQEVATTTSAEALALIEQYVTAEYGERCKTSDIEDFPDLKGSPDASRCATCKAWEEVDRFKDWLESTAQSRPRLDPRTVTRFEVIDHTTDGEGRVYVKYDVSVDLSYQDDGRTLKAFVADRMDGDA